MHVIGGKVWRCLLYGSLTVAAVAFDTATAQDTEDHRDADSYQQICERMTQVTSQIGKQEDTDSCVQQDGEDSSKCAT